MVVVDVVASDKKGQAVTDLEASNFSLREDGKEQQISTFNFQRPSPEAPPARDGRPLPPNMFHNAPKFQSKSALNVILVDALNSNLLNQAYIRVEMVQFLNKLPQGQPIAIYALGKKLRLLQDFTTDLTELKNVITAFKGQSSHVLSNPAGTSDAPMTPQGMAAEVAQTWAPQLMTQIESFERESLADQMDFRVQYTMTALNSLARTLAGYPGRKNLIWISESIPMNIVPDAKSLSSRALHNYADQMALTANLLADAQIAVYPIDARGLVNSAFYNVANNVGGQAAMGGAASRAEGGLAEELLQAHGNMEDVAAQTGGKAFFNRNDIDQAVRGDIADGSTYYSLGYYPANKDWNGRFRKIQITSKRAGVKLRYRLGYFAVDRAGYIRHHPQQQNLELDLALNPDSPAATALQFQATVALPSEETGNKVQVNYAIDPREISFARGADGLEHAEVDCAARVFVPSADKPVKTEGARMQAALKPEMYSKINQSFFPCQLSLELAAGDYFLRLAVRDNMTGRLGAVNARVTVPAGSASADGKSGAMHH